MTSTVNYIGLLSVDKRAGFAIHCICTALDYQDDYYDLTDEPLPRNEYRALEKLINYQIENDLSDLASAGPGRSASFILTSSHKDVIKPENEDRRYLTFFDPKIPKEITLAGQVTLDQLMNSPTFTGLDIAISPGKEGYQCSSCKKEIEKTSKDAAECPHCGIKFDKPGNLKLEASTDGGKTFDKIKTVKTPENSEMTEIKTFDDFHSNPMNLANRED